MGNTAKYPIQNHRNWGIIHLSSRSVIKAAMMMSENATFPYTQKLPNAEAFDILPNWQQHEQLSHYQHSYIFHLKGILTSPGEDNQGLNRLKKKTHPGQLSLFRQIPEKQLCWVPWYSAGSAGNFWRGVQLFSEANVSLIIKHSKPSKDYHLMCLWKVASTSCDILLEQQ